MVIVVVAVVAGIVMWKLKEPGRPDAMLCSPKNIPTAHVILLVDKTDPLTFTQAKAFNQILGDLVSGKLVREGELLSVFVLGEDFRETADPIFEKCNPGDGTGRSGVNDNPKLWKDLHDVEYAKPLLALESQMRALEPGKYSPILQMLQVVALCYSKYHVPGPKRLIIVSDMLQNTPEISFFRMTPTFADAQKAPTFARLRAKLNSVDVTIRMLHHSPQLQKTPLAKFWEDYFREMGGTLQEIDPLPG